MSNAANLMRAPRYVVFVCSIGAAVLSCGGSPLRAAENVSPADIQKMFAVGKPFSATAPSGKTVMITLNPDGTAKAISPGKKKGQKGTWRVSNTGYCSTWGKGAEHCYMLRQKGDGYDVVTQTGIIIAHWSKP